MKTVQTTDRCIDIPTGHLFVRHWQPTDAVEAPPIILLHDSLGSVELWRDFPERLATELGRPVVAYDRLGFGGSSPHPGMLAVDFIRNEAHESFREIKDALGITRFSVFGHSVGGGMAVGIAAAYPDECEAMVTMSAQAFVEDRTVAGIRAAQGTFAEPGQLDRLRRYHGDKAPWVLSAWIDRWLAPDFAGWSLDPDLPHVRCPNLVLHGNRDEYGSSEHPRRIAELSAGPSALHIGDWGHVPWREEPATIIRLVNAWFVDSGTSQI